jgi:hypothetical protein
LLATRKIRGKNFTVSLSSKISNFGQNAHEDSYKSQVLTSRMHPTFRNDAQRPGRTLKVAPSSPKTLPHPPTEIGRLSD